jgi:hypothetical protein
MMYLETSVRTVEGLSDTEGKIIIYVNFFLIKTEAREVRVL